MTQRLMTHDQSRALTIRDLLDAKREGRKIVVLTCYDALTARVLDPIVDLLLVGDSVNQVVAGHGTTLSATLDQMIYHAAAVRRGCEPRTGVRGSAVPDLSDLDRRGAAQCGQSPAGERGARREAGRRPSHGRDDPRPGTGRHPCDGTPRPHAAVCQRARRVPGSGQGGRYRHPAHWKMPRRWKRRVPVRWFSS